MFELMRQAFECGLYEAIFFRIGRRGWDVTLIFVIEEARYCVGVRVCSALVWQMKDLEPLQFDGDWLLPAVDVELMCTVSFV